MSTSLRVTALILLNLACLFPQSTAQAQIFNSTWSGSVNDSWTNAGNWSTTNFPHNNGGEFYNVFITGGGDLVNKTGIHDIDSMTIGGGAILNLLNGSTLTIHEDAGRSASGQLVNSGQINLNATSLVTTLRFGGTVTLSGGGTIRLGNDSQNQITGVNNGLLINEDNLIAGSGTIGTSNTLALLNRGSIVADQSVGLNVVLTEGVTNEGIFRATNGAVLNLNGGTILNTGGTIEAENASTVLLTNATIDGGLIQTAGTGVINAVAGSAFDSSTNQVTVDGTVNVNNGQTLNIIGDLINKQDINFNATSLVTSFRINGDVELSGGGTINLGNDSQNRILGISGGKLTNVDHLIRGSGIIGTSNTLELVNQSLIEADQSVGMTLVAGAGVDNQGTLRAKNGSTLLITGGTVQNQTGLIEAANASTVNLQSATIVGGTLRSLGTGVFNASNTTLDGSTGTVILDGTMNVGNGQSLTLIDSLQNSATTINLNATSLVTNLQIDGAVDLTGGGTIQMSNDSQNVIRGTNGGFLTNHDNLIRGSGTIGFSNSLQLLNKGTIEAHQSVPLTIVGAPGVTNENIIRAVKGGTLVLSGGTFNNQLGQISASNGSIINLQSTTIQGGSLTADATSSILTTNSTLDGSSSQLTLDGTLLVNNGQNIRLLGDINNVSSSIHVNATSLVSRINVDGTVNLTGGGSIVMNNDVQNRITGISNGHLINEDNIISGSGFIGFNDLQLTNRGIIDSNNSVGMTIDPNAGGVLNDTGGLIRVTGTGGMFFGTGNHTNRGTVLVNPGRNLFINNGANFENDGGDVLIGLGGEVSVTGTFLQTDGTTIVDGTLNSSILNDFNGGTLQGSGLVEGVSDFSMLAKIAAGSSVGILEFDDMVTMAGTFDVEIEGLLVEGVIQDINFVNTGSDDSLIDFDQVNVFDSLVLEDGTVIDVSRLNGFLPQVGDFFDVVTADNISLLGSLNIQTDSPGLTFSADVLTLFDQTTGTNRDVLRLTTLTAVPEPGSLALIGFAAIVMAVRRRRK